MSHALSNLPGIASLSRRQILQSTGSGFGYLALAGLLGHNSSAKAAEKTSDEKPLAPKPPHFPTKVKRVIFLFMEGAMSHVDTFEYKTALQQNDQKPGPGGGKLVASKFRFAQHGQSGAWVSELYPNVAKQVDIA